MHNEPRSDFFRKSVPEFDHLLELVAGVDVKEGKWQWPRIERFARKVNQHARVFADRIQQDRVPELRNRFPENINRLALELSKMRPVGIHVLNSPPKLGGKFMPFLHVGANHTLWNLSPTTIGPRGCLRP